MKKNSKKLIYFAVALIFIVAAAVISVVYMNKAPYVEMMKNTEEYKVEKVDLSVKGDRIYFLNTGSADAILIESEGKFALVDAAEDSDNPRGFEDLAFPGTEQYVVDAIKKIAGDKKGKATLEFVLGTHSHSDHIGGMDTVILDKDITVKTAYLKKYDESKIETYEIERWDNTEVYEQMVSACKERNVKLVQDMNEDKFTFGNFTMQFCNVYDPEKSELVGENDNAVGLLIEKDGMRAFLAADIDNRSGDEDRLSQQIGKVNLLKVGHHGYNESTSEGFVNALSPEIAVVTNSEGRMSRTPLENLNNAGACVFETGRYNGVVADFNSDKIVVFGNIDV